ncbi:hypothetical protein ACFLS0_00390 [Candidatus Bipolaricaulota bacterium]
MSSRWALREIEKKVWFRTFEHGMWDIGVGSMFMMFGLSILASFPALSGIWVAALLPGFREIGRKLVVPRIGHVHFRERRKRATGRLTGILTVTAVMGMVTFLFITWLLRGAAPAWAQWIGDHFVIFIGLIWGGALAVAGWLVDFPRLYAYGALMFVSLLITDFAKGYHLGSSLTVVGGLILLTGIILLIRFLRRYPRQEDLVPESPDE